MVRHTIQIIKKGITDFTADCIVNAANERLSHGGGVCGAIFRAAGANQLTAACSRIGHCDTGSAVITPAFNLNTRYIIHAVGPIYMDGMHGEPSLLYDCYKKSLELAMEHDCHSIVFPLISAGIFGYPAADAWRRAIRACDNFLKKNPDYSMEIFFAVLDDRIMQLGLKTLAGISPQPEAAPTARRATAEDRVAIFQDTQKWIADDPALTAEVAFSKQHTKVFYENDYPFFDCEKTRTQIVEVTRERSFEAAVRLQGEDASARIAVMNFANAFHPGGGVTKGASAQEESLCRCSTLYPCLYRQTLKTAFYDYHSDLGTSKATDSLIYTEGVAIIKTDEEFPRRLPQSAWVHADIITIAAPDLRAKSNQYAPLIGNGTYMNNAELFGYHVRRAMHVLTVAAHYGVDNLVLGAFGCGAFQNDPQTVARAYKVALDVFPKVFKKVTFAVYCTPRDSTNYDAFSAELCSLQ